MNNVPDASSAVRLSTEPTNAPLRMPPPMPVQVPVTGSRAASDEAGTSPAWVKGWGGGVVSELGSSGGARGR